MENAANQRQEAPQSEQPRLHQMAEPSEVEPSQEEAASLESSILDHRSKLVQIDALLKDDSFEAAKRRELEELKSQLRENMILKQN